MIVVTGAAGFIGSCMAGYLLQHTSSPVIGADDFEHIHKVPNFRYKGITRLIPRSHLLEYLRNSSETVEAIIHLGARTDTVDRKLEIFEALNLQYSKDLWTYCTKHEVPFIYASSAATYGDGAFGFDDEMEDISVLKPLNAYGRSKHAFDEWVLTQKDTPPKWIGLKFFNVYGPNEYHKQRMASVIFHAFHQIMQTGEMKLFRSHRSDFGNGLQMRDFIYVFDVCATILKLMEHPFSSGIYNLGTGQANSFLNLVTAVFKGVGRVPQIKFIDIPEDIRANYQYFTEAKMDKIKKAGLAFEFKSLEEGIEEYVGKYLVHNKYY